MGSGDGLVAKRSRGCTDISIRGLFCPRHPCITDDFWLGVWVQGTVQPEVFAKEEEKMQRKKLAHLQHLTTALNYHLVSNP